jgi:hypothetical protein
MERIGDDKKLRALYSETRFGDEQVVPSFSATWHRAQSRAKQPRRTVAFAFASALVLVIFAVATFAVWSKYSDQPQTYSAFASAAAANLALPNGGSRITPPTVTVNRVIVPIRSRTNKLAAQRQQLMVAENRQAQKEAKEIAIWQSPTASLLSSSSDDLFKSLPQLNQNANEMKSFLPNRSNDKEN